mmetsp:Transcript_5843/g.11707  ORF Transcript_5843/g.11707 Transcript_5843/m.11707 type:complete len:218 (-) Transcript_5843:1027-1680(-)
MAKFQDRLERHFLFFGIRHIGFEHSQVYRCQEYFKRNFEMIGNTLKEIENDSKCQAQNQQIMRRTPLQQVFAKIILEDTDFGRTRFFATRFESNIDGCQTAHNNLFRIDGRVEQGGQLGKNQLSRLAHQRPRSGKDLEHNLRKGIRGSGFEERTCGLRNVTDMQACIQQSHHQIRSEERIGFGKGTSHHQCGQIQQFEYHLFILTVMMVMRGSHPGI